MSPSKGLQARAKRKRAPFTAHRLPVVNHRHATGAHEAPKPGSLVVQRRLAGYAAPWHQSAAHALASSIE
ncbi:MAG: hypothetical protein LW710_01565 [Burkholderiales bacterium]|uniref:hypothetical protein n=1 Tax=Limnobacter sp. TaxID=2003368 RepID=UPI00395B8330|nr:hypothetical protein [Burkholderiales bacterium]